MGMDVNAVCQPTDDKSIRHQFLQVVYEAVAQGFAITCGIACTYHTDDVAAV